MAAAPPSPTDDQPVPSRQGTRGGGGVIMLCAAALVLLAVTLFGGNDTSSDTYHPPNPPRAGASATPRESPSATPRDSPSATPRESPSATRERDSETKHLPRSQPVRLLIPKISVDAPFMDLAIGAGGQLEAPPPNDTNLVGWYAKGISPGERGTSIIAGHVDTKTSAAVFAGLFELGEGDVFHVRRADGRTASFTVDSVETFQKDDFPSRRVYDDTDRAEVRLITCAGAYDRAAQDYKENLVVFAHLI
ncbi:class F sortase [Streptomyces viridiviolaceus]|uniref:Class F sortase n=1 Tax=Streptomyces viridiviolaceus TaxID=68282 RepID=A0ABW2DUI3_9ACTN|nr:class F sortase [Streptomyces viridiviolaceus]